MKNMFVALADQPLTLIACWISAISCASVRQTVVSPNGSSQPLVGKACVSVQEPP